MNRTNHSPSLPASVIVPVLNGVETIGACLTALLAQTVNDSSYEILVVDDGSTDGSAQAAARFGVIMIQQEHAGAAAARNRGAQQAKGQILLFTDADCEPMPDWIEEMLVPFANPGVVGVKGVYRTRQRSLVARFTQAEYEEKYSRLARADRIDFVDTYAAAYRRDVFWEHGGFDEQFLYDEDQEFSFRLARAGHKLVFAPEAVVFHQHPQTVLNYCWRKVRLGRWKVRVHVRHPAKAVRDSYTPWSQKAQIVLLPLTILAVLAAALGLTTWLIAAALAGVGLLSVVPLLNKSVRQGWLVVMVSPVLVAFRALALGLGLLWGIAIQFGTQFIERGGD
jgi:cellulose synthase/poly-beta-1,6-N-acetylglucosamine synthase-like glycosyltransferase